MKRILEPLQWVMVAALLASSLPSSLEAKSYSSGGGRSYSSSRSSSSGGSRSSGSSMGSSRSSSSRSSRSSSSDSSVSRSSKGFSSGSGKSYGSSSSDDSRRSYTSGKSYTSGAAKSEPDSTKFTFDSGAARARQEEASRKSFNDYKDSMARKNGSTASSSGGAVPPRIDTPSQPASGGGSSWNGRRTYIPDQDTVRTRPWRMYERYSPYYSRPVVVYRDSYNSFFWWWLLDRSLDERAYWAYHHRYDMDPARYQALVADNRELESRVEQLEAQRVPRDTNYVPANLDRDLMYSDRHVSRVYSNRPTAAGAVLFWLLAIPTALGIGAFLVWLIFFKRWQVSTT